jgi:ATP-dependent RNA helicase RhlE
LIATDVVSRGVDIYKIHAVVNYSFPKEDSRYVHRIGRTARAGEHGLTFTLCNDVEKR